MPLIASIKTWINNEILTATDLNAALAEIRTTTNTWAAFRDQAQTFTAAQTFALNTTFQAGVTVSAGGVAVTGNSTITGTLGGLTGLTVASGGASITGNSSVTGTLSATTFSGSGASLTTLPAANLTGALPAISGAALTGLNATNITTGTLDEARITTLTASKLSGALPAISGANLTNLNGSNIATGTVAAARLPGTLTNGTIIGNFEARQNTVGVGAINITNSQAAAIAFQITSGYDFSGNQAFPLLTTGPNYPIGATHVEWRWIRMTLGGLDCFMPVSRYS